MKKLFLLLVILPLFFISCSKEEAPVLTISQTSISAPSAGNSTTIALFANNPWSVSGPDWCVVSPSRGEGGEVAVTVTVKENTTYDARNCTLTFSSMDLMESVTVNQDTNFGIVLPKNSYEVSSEAQQINVEVKANITYDVTIDADWIKLSGTKALSSKTFSFDIEKNETYDAREGTITIQERNGNDVKTIKVKQAQFDAIIISSKEYSLSSKSQSLEVKLQTNVDLDIIIPDNAKPWISHTSTKALSDKTLVFDIKENNEYSARVCEVVVKKKNSTLADTLKIGQAQKDAIVLSQKEYKLSSDKHSLEVKLQTNVDLEVNIPESAKSWISYVETKALADKVVILSVESNGTYGERTSEIYIKDKASSLQDTVKIIQAQNDAIILSQKEYKLSSEKQSFEVKLQTNVDIEINIPESANSWVSIVETKALNNKTLVFEIKENETNSDRVCDVIIKKNDNTLADTLKIIQAQKDAIVISQKEYKLSAEKQTFSVKLQTNTNIQVNIPESAKSWLSYIETKALENKELVFSIESNTSYGERTSFIYITDANSSLQDTIKVIQAQNDAIITPANEYELKGEAQYFEIKIQTNVEFKVVIPDNAKSWISLVETKALDNKTLVFDIKKNDTQETRICELSITCDQGITQKIKIKQLPDVTFKLNKNNAKIILGDAIKLTLDNSSGKTVIWSSTNENIAKVDQDGNVTGISKGTAVIEVSTEDGQHKASCNVNVLEITDAVVFSFMTMSHISYDGIIAPGATIGWKVSNNGSSPITVKKLILKDYENASVNTEYSVSDGEIAPESAAGWQIRTLVPTKAPYCYAVFEYKGIEYQTNTAKTPFN